MVIIYALEGTIEAKKQPLSDAIHKAMCEVLGLPEQKRFHRFMPMKEENFFFPDDRSSEYTVIEVRMMEGRPKELIKQFIYALFDHIKHIVKIEPRDVEITVMTQPTYCWGFRGLVGEDAHLDYALTPHQND